MNILTKLTAVLAFVSIGFYGNCQMSKSEAQQFISAHSTSSVQRLFVTRKVEYNASNNDFAKSDVLFDPATASITALDNSLRIKDGSGMDMFIPYSSIKCLTYQPETDKLYSSISVLVQ